MVPIKGCKIFSKKRRDFNKRGGYKTPPGVGEHPLWGDFFNPAERGAHNYQRGGAKTIFFPKKGEREELLFDPQRGGGIYHGKPKDRGGGTHTGL